MPTNLGPEYTSDYPARPQQISVEDLTIWNRLRDRHSAQWLRVWFDVHLGAGHPGDPSLPDNLQKMWLESTQKRADLIAETATEIWLVELRNTAQMNAVGRLLGYLRLLAQDNPFTKPVVPYLVTNARDLEVKDLAEAMGIRYLVI